MTDTAAVRTILRAAASRESPRCRAWNPAGATSSLPITGGRRRGSTTFIIEGRAAAAARRTELERRRGAGHAGLLRNDADSRCVAGRPIEARDAREAPWVAVINEEAVRIYWPDESPDRPAYSLSIARKPRRSASMDHDRGRRRELRARTARRRSWGRRSSCRMRRCRATNLGGRYMAIVVRAVAGSARRRGRR